MKGISVVAAKRRSDVSGLIQPRLGMRKTVVSKGANLIDLKLPPKQTRKS
jgi:hypothetical protein